MSSTEGEVSRRDFDALSRRLDEVHDSLRDLARARTPGERREARGDVEDSEDAFRRHARRLGLDDDDIAGALKAKRKKELRDLLDEIAAESIGDDDSKPDDDDGDDDDKDDDAEKVSSLRDAAAARSEGKKVRAPRRPAVDKPPAAGEKSLAARILGS